MLGRSPVRGRGGWRSWVIPQCLAQLPLHRHIVQDEHLLQHAETFVEVGDLLPSSHYAERLKRVPKAWDKAFEVNASENEAVRASCVEFVLAGLYATDRISRSQKHGRITYEIR